MTQIPEISDIIFDFDGVFTDNRVWVSQDGSESVACSRADGLGVKWLRERGVNMIVLTTELNPVVEARCRKLCLEHFVAPVDKRAVLSAFANTRGIALQNAAYVGNDLNDLGAMELCGWIITPSDADPAVRKIADTVLETPGGNGVTKEIYRRMFPLEWEEKCRFRSTVK